MSSNIFQPSIKNIFRKLFEIYRLNFRLSLILIAYFLKSILKFKTTQAEKSLYYYYLILINCDSYHKSYLPPKYYFAGKDVFFTARSGVGYSDLENLNQIFGRNEYIDTINLYKAHFRGIPEYIVDAGANVGYATLFFHSFFPTAKYICIEPDLNNFLLLEENCRNNNIQSSYLINNGIWNKDVYLTIEQDSLKLGTWGYTYIESELPTNMMAVDFKKLIKDKKISSLDILKIDIEGTEAILFHNGYMKEILCTTKVIAIEIHNDKADREDITNQLLNAGFLLHNIGDMTFGYNQLLKSN